MGKRKSPKPWGLTSWLALLLGGLFVALSSGCAPTPKPSLQIATPVWLREACVRPSLPQGDAPTVGQILSFSVDQEAALADCDTRRAQALKLITDANAIAAGSNPNASKRNRFWSFGQARRAQ
jgi:hypothetical protein